MVSEFTQEAAQKLFGGEQKHHLLLFVSKTSADFQNLLDVYKQAAPKYHGQVSLLCSTSLLQEHYVLVTVIMHSPKSTVVLILKYKT